MIDFTSALYLGLYHPVGSIPPWSKLTTGVPAAFHVAPPVRTVARQLAALHSAQDAVVVPSTLHLFWDLFDILARRHCIFYIDALAYPIARWGLERASAHGAKTRFFTHHDPHMLEVHMDKDGCQNKRPVVVTDGFCPGCGRSAPLKDYLDLVRHRNGLVVLDDTQALGLLGRRKPGSAPYGAGGGGSTSWQDIADPDILVAGSMAKGFGVPMAFLSGGKRWMDVFERESQTHIHCSPPSMAVVHAAASALARNRDSGRKLRRRLAERVRYFQRCLRRIGLFPIRSLFPVQPLELPVEIDVRRLHGRLWAKGIRTVLSRDRHRMSPRMAFILRSDQRMEDIASAVDALAKILSHRSVRMKPGKYGGVIYGSSGSQEN